MLKKHSNDRCYSKWRTKPSDPPSLNLLSAEYFHDIIWYMAQLTVKTHIDLTIDSTPSINCHSSDTEENIMERLRLTVQQRTTFNCAQWFDEHRHWITASKCGCVLIQKTIQYNSAILYLHETTATTSIADCLGKKNEDKVFFVCVLAYADEWTSRYSS